MAFDRKKYMAKYNRRYYYAHQAEEQAASKAYYHAHKNDPTFKEKAAESQARWYWSEAGQKKFAAYRKRKSYLRKLKIWNREWRRNNKEKVSAHRKVRDALLRGDIVRPKRCQNCNDKVKPEAHHDDYSKPLEVMWLCRKCHVRIHPHNRWNKPVAKL